MWHGGKRDCDSGHKTNERNGAFVYLAELFWEWIVASNCCIRPHSGGFILERSTWPLKSWQKLGKLGRRKEYVVGEERSKWRNNGRDAGRILETSDLTFRWGCVGEMSINDHLFLILVHLIPFLHLCMLSIWLLIVFLFFFLSVTLNEIFRYIKKLIMCR